MSDLKLRALSHARIMSQGLYGNRIGAAFHAMASREILLEATRFIISDIKEFMSQESDPTIREVVYPKWYNGILKGSEGVFSCSRHDQDRALNSFFKAQTLLAFNHDDWTDYHLEGLENVGLNEVHTAPDEWDLDRQIAKPYRDLGFNFYTSEILDDTPLSIQRNWSQIALNGNKDRVGLTVRYGFYI